MTPWRLFLDADHIGARNMAVDEAMLLAHARGLTPPTLRFYGWNPACLSLGRLQKQLPDAVTRGGADFDIVRRPTGGRAVWHAQEITYSVVARAELLPPGARSVEGAYRWLSAGFLHGLRALGIPAEMAPGGVRTNGTNCFAASAGCDFVAGGKKLIGAAQCRHDQTILQHGSLLLSIDAENWRHAGDPTEGSTERAMEGATSLELLGASLEREAVVEALTRGFAAHVAEHAQTTWENRSLGAREIELAQLLLTHKYGSESWTLGARVEGETQYLIDQKIRAWGPK